MGLNLFQGGHLSHGSPFHISGRQYQVVSYDVDPNTERLDYEQIMVQACQHRPKIIVAGYTSYPWAPDWARFREIADAAGAYLMADISHPAGLVTAGLYPNPVGLADVTMFTTHKTLCGPRGAVIITTDPEKSQMIDTAVFPGSQGGPHPNKFAAMAVAFKIAATPEFKALQRQIVDNAQSLGESLQKRGMELAYGGTDTHMLLLDLRHMRGKHGYPLLGEIVVRVLELCGIVANRNTVPGDVVTAQARAVRLGTPWVTQRGMGPDEMDQIAGAIHSIVAAIEPFTYEGLIGLMPRGKISLKILESVKANVDLLATPFATGTDSQASGAGYPHYFIMESERLDENDSGNNPGRRVLAISGWRAAPFVQQINTNRLSDLTPGQQRRSLLLDRQGKLMDDVFVKRLEPDQRGRDSFLMAIHEAGAAHVKAWLRGLGDGYLLFDPDDLFAKVEGPAVIIDLASDPLQNDLHVGLVEAGQTFLRDINASEAQHPTHPAPAGDAPTAESLYDSGHEDLFDLSRPYFVGQKSFSNISLPAKPEWVWQEPQDVPLKRTCLYQEHLRLTRHLVPFAGWEMPVRYTSVAEEHLATRTTAALFDVSHMGVLRISGPHATSFLNVATTNYAGWLEDGESQYSHLLAPNGDVIDDIMVYRRRADDYLVVVNAANADKDWDWLNAVNRQEVRLDDAAPYKTIEQPAVIQDLKDPRLGPDQKVDIALQGPESRNILAHLSSDSQTRDDLHRLQRTQLMDGRLADVNVIIAHTGYTGESIGYEIFVHPDQAPRLWNTILETGADLGVKPAGLAARDSTRTEAGLPLYGHELAGPFNVDPAECGFASYVKLHKPFFVGRKAYIDRLRDSEMTVIRFRMEEKGVRPPKTGDPVVNNRGQMIGWVSSAASDLEGYLIGMAYVQKSKAQPGARIGVFHAGGKSELGLARSASR